MRSREFGCEVFVGGGLEENSLVGWEVLDEGGARWRVAAEFDAFSYQCLGHCWKDGGGGRLR